jgi:hypothetical protein
MQKTVITDGKPALRAFLNARQKHSATIEHMNKLADDAMAEQRAEQAREAERARSKRPRLVSNRG